MAEKIAIEASRNPRLQWGLALACLMLSSGIIAQFSKRELACDTTVFDHHYTLCIKNWKGAYIAFGNRNEKGERHGWWCDLNGDPENRTEGEYLNDNRAGTWWMSKREIWHYDQKGRIIAKGSGCRGCPPF
jgi:hypothetical protein